MRSLRAKATMFYQHFNDYNNNCYSKADAALTTFSETLGAWTAGVQCAATDRIRVAQLYK